MPTKTKLKNNLKPVIVNFTPEQKLIIQKNARNMGLTMAAYIRLKSLQVSEQKNINFTQENKFTRFAGVLNNQDAKNMLKSVKDKINKD